MENDEGKLAEKKGPHDGWAVNPAKCSGCGECIVACGRSLLKIENRRVTNIRPTGCNLCGDCANACGYDAIVLT